MTIQPDEKSAQPKISRPEWFLAGGCGVVLLLIAGCVTVWFFVFQGGGGEAASASVAERATKEFVQTLHDGDMEAGHRMLSEKIRSTTSTDDIAGIVRMDDNRVIFETYQSLQVCDWGLFMTGDGRFLSAKGLLHYEGGNIVFESNLHQDSNGVWRIYWFGLRREIDPKPFGHCR
jgi:hypothetical protein